MRLHIRFFRTGVPRLFSLLVLFAMQSCAPGMEEVTGAAVSEATPCNPHTRLFRFYIRTAEGTRHLDIECNDALRSGISSNKKISLVLERQDSLFEERRYRVRSAKIEGREVVVHVR